MEMNNDPEWLKKMAEIEATQKSVAAGVFSVEAFGGLTGYIPNHKRCGCFLFQRGGVNFAHLPCTRRRGHKGKHRIWVKILGRRGRKHLKWVDMPYRVSFALAT